MNRRKVERQMLELYNKRIDEFIHTAVALFQDGWNVHMTGLGEFSLLAVGNRDRIVMLEAMPTNVAMNVLNEIVFRSLVTNSPHRPPQRKRPPKPGRRNRRNDME